MPTQPAGVQNFPQRITALVKVLSKYNAAPGSRQGAAVSRLTNLIAHAKAKAPQLGVDLDRAFKVLSSRLPFGLSFERHSPEAVELPPAPRVPSL